MHDNPKMTGQENSLKIIRAVEVACHKVHKEG